MRDNPMCAECCRLDLLDADPSTPCPLCDVRQELKSSDRPMSKLARAVEIARGGPPHGTR